MNIDELMALRIKEKEYFNLNGYENGDFETNGEMFVLESMKRFFRLFIDIGANVGEITKKVISLNNETQVICFEANPQLYKSLSDTFSENQNVQVEVVALSSKMGEANLFVHASDAGTSSLFQRHEMMPSFTKHMIQVPIIMTILDKYINIITSKSGGQGIFIKVDVEGSELPVLIGANNCLQLNCPIFVMFEYSYGWKESGQSLKEAFHYLDNYGFSLFRVTPLGLERVRFFTLDMDNPYYCNYFAVRNFDVSRAFKKVKQIAVKYGFTDFYPFDFLCTTE